MSFRRNSYAITWSLAAVVILALIVLVFQFRPPPDKQMNIDPKAYIPAEKRLEQERKQAGVNPLIENPPDVNVKDTEIELSNENGSVKMRISSGEVFSREGVVKLPAASLEFFFGDQRKLNIAAKDLTYTLKEETAEVLGELSGEIPTMRLRFTAKGLVWDKRTSKMILKQATISDPSFKATAKDISVDISADELSVLGGMQVDI